MSDCPAIDLLFDALSRICARHADLRAEITKLWRIRAWAMERAGIDFAAGDRVEIADDFASWINLGHGWYPYREVLAKGATGVVRGVDFTGAHSAPGWFACVVFDREWITASSPSGVIRYWHGPVADTPEGFEPPSEFDQEHDPQGRRHTFVINVERLRRARNDEHRDGPRTGHPDMEDVAP